MGHSLEKEARLAEALANSEGNTEWLVGGGNSK